LFSGRQIGSADERKPTPEEIPAGTSPAELRPAKFKLARGAPAGGEASKEGQAKEILAGEKMNSSFLIVM
jgi:hypothetical protein